MSVYAVDKLMSEARKLAAEYRKVTGKTLPLSGEIALNDAIRLLGLEPVTDMALGYDALRRHGEQIERCLVKARVVFDASKGAHRLGELKFDKPWDTLLVVLMDADYETMQIHAVTRAAAEAAIAARPEQKRAGLTIAKVKIIGSQVWVREAPAALDASTA
jgi:hypothetical protein